MAKNLVTVPIMAFPAGKFKGGRHGIVHPAAADATQVIVLGGVGVEAGFSPRMFELCDHTNTSQQVKVAVHGAQAHSRQSPPHEFMEFNRRGVRSDGL